MSKPLWYVPQSTIEKCTELFLPNHACFVLFWLQSFIVYVLIPRGQEQEKQLWFFALHQAQVKAHESWPEKLAQHWLCQAFFFTTGETNRTNASTLCSVDSKSFVGDAFWFNRVLVPLSKICTNLAGVQSSIWQRPLQKNEKMMCLGFKAYANTKMLLKIRHFWALKISIIPENLTDFGHIKIK